MVASNIAGILTAKISETGLDLEAGTPSCWIRFRSTNTKAVLESDGME
jgi:hypothetical protein